ncbi:MAG: response regulator [Verrucomicrobiota bacterium]
MTAKSVILVDDHDATRAEMASIIEDEDDFDVVGQASNGEDGVKLAMQKKPSLIVMDLVMPGISGIEAAKQISLFDSDIKILALSNHSNKTMVKAVLQSGVTGYVRKDQAYEELLPAMRTVLKGETYMGRRLED